MRATAIPNSPDFVRKTFILSDLLERASAAKRSHWTDIPKCQGVYVVYWTLTKPPTFKGTMGVATYATPTLPGVLRARCERICKKSPTDIIYIGKANSIRTRVRTLAGFGVGKSDKHKGGEWMWQISHIETAGVLVQTCPSGRQVGFENWLLEEFRRQHGDWPLANREGPEGSDRWWPNEAATRP